ncbi:Glycine/D-amino acid oxidase (deaminating) [Fodinibius salinus]|uniref:Glycine/D-amino acid oxidase (Deaminating) n=1 Tax=Fodinibius salinus TaxID=860790 RepID=A0A5D3YS95_9BACT|nr:FAD-dependent oxidoreductase [Fodinibius salinus]TYP95421.1 Glycine/D-amino acid oxidase (deaminating) [Fodinibius salinus]
MNHQTDFCILGAGLAGLSLANVLLEHDVSVTVIDKDSVAAGASGTPGGLVNPATGRRAKKSWKAEQCYEAIAENLEKIQRTSETTFYQNNGLLRPALLEKMARKMKAQREKTSWPDGWCQWKTEDEIKDIHPGISCVDGGLWLPIGLTVNVGQYLQAYAAYLKDQGLNLITGAAPRKIYHDDSWKIDLPHSTVSARHIFFAMGQHTHQTKFWDWLPVNLIKGQVATFRSPQKLSFDHSISSLGYMARPDDEYTFVQGSTYEHDFDHLNPDEEGEQYLRKRMRRTLPQLEETVKTIDQWAGVRTSTPNYKPILGPHPKHQNMHVFTGLGSKGLLYGKFLANHYGDYLFNNTSLFPDIDVERCLSNANQ